MPATPESEARTRAFARVIGPFLVIVPGIIAARAPDMGVQLSAFFENAALVWITGGLLVFAGWSSASAILISLFGWFLALRGLALLSVPHLYEKAGIEAMNAISLVRIGFGLLVLAGLWLTYTGWIEKQPPHP